MTNKHTALTPFATKIKVVAPSKMKVLGMIGGSILSSNFQPEWTSRAGTRNLAPPSSTLVLVFFELTVLRATFQSNSCIEINHFILLYPGTEVPSSFHQKKKEAEGTRWIHARPWASCSLTSQATSPMLEFAQSIYPPFQSSSPQEVLLVACSLTQRNLSKGFGTPHRLL